MRGSNEWLFDASSSLLPRPLSRPFISIDVLIENAEGSVNPTGLDLHKPLMNAPESVGNALRLQLRSFPVIYDHFHLKNCLACLTVMIDAETIKPVLKDNRRSTIERTITFSLPRSSRNNLITNRPDHSTIIGVGHL